MSEDEKKFICAQKRCKAKVDKEGERCEKCKKKVEEHRLRHLFVMT